MTCRQIEGEVIQVLPPQRRTRDGLFVADAIPVFNNGAYADRVVTVVRTGGLPERRFDTLKSLFPILFRRNWDEHHPTVIFDEAAAPAEGERVSVEAERVREGSEVGWVPV